MAGEDGPSFLKVSGVVVQEDTAVPEAQEVEARGGGGGSAQEGVASKQCPVALQAFLKWNSRQETRQRRQSCCHVALLLFDVSCASCGAAPPGLVRLCQHRRPRFNKVIISN